LSTGDLIIFDCWIGRGRPPPAADPRLVRPPLREGPQRPGRERKGLERRLKGKLAVDLAEYLRAYAETSGQAVEVEQLVPHMLANFMDADRGFQAWRKTAAGKTPAAG
jgi:hypothetical protein